MGSDPAYNLRQSVRRRRNSAAPTPSTMSALGDPCTSQQPPASTGSVQTGATSVFGGAVAGASIRTVPSYDATTSASPLTARPASTGIPSDVLHSERPVESSSALSMPFV